MRSYQKILTSVLVLSIFGYYSCRKTDRSTEPNLPSAIETKFFLNRTSTDPVVQSVTAFTKKENSKLHFVENLVKKIGYPYWNKSIVRPGKRGAVEKNQDENAFTVYVPFVLDTAHVVHASLIVSMSPGDTTIQIVQDWQYKDREYGNPNVDTTAENLALLFMTFDNLVFGHSSFSIIDSNLFRSPNILHATGNKISIVSNGAGSRGVYNRSTLLSVYWCQELYFCGTIPQCTNLYGPGNCDWANPCPVSMCFGEYQCAYYEVESGSGGGGSGGGSGSGSGSGSGGSGGGSGGDPWNPPQCPGPQAKSLLYENCTPGWIPPPPPPNCDPLITALRNNATFKQKMMTINGKTNLDYEAGYAIRNIADGDAPNNYESQDGTPFASEIDWSSVVTPGTLWDAIIHSHSRKLNSIFSPGDILFMAEMFVRNYHRLSENFFFVMASNRDNPYLIKIANADRFRTFANKILAMEAKNGGFTSKYNTRFNSPNSNDNLKEFMKMLEEQGALSAAQLFESPPNNSSVYDFESWRKITWDGFEVSYTTCN